MSNQIGTFLPFHTVQAILFGRLQEGNLVLLQALWWVETLWCELSPKPIQWPNSPVRLHVNVMRILALLLNKVRHFYYSFLNSLCFSWNGRALGGAHLPCSGVSPPGALGFPPLLLSLRYVWFCNRIETLRPTKITGKTLIQITVWADNSKSRFFWAIFVFFSSRLELTTVSGSDAVASSWYAFLWSYLPQRNARFL